MAYWPDLKWHLFIGAWALVEQLRERARADTAEATISNLDTRLASTEKALSKIHDRFVYARAMEDPPTPMELEISSVLAKVAQMRMVAAGGVVRPVVVEATTSAVEASAVTPADTEPDRPAESK